MTTLRITALGHRGDGIADLGGRRVYVPHTLPGETVDAEVEGDRGSLVSVLDASADRIAPISRYFGRCGGCLLQHMSPAAYTTFKHRLVTDILRQSHLETAVSPMIDATGLGRRRATLHADKNAAGYMRVRSHELLNVETCVILVSELRDAAPRIARRIGARLGQCDVLFTAAENGIDVAVHTKRRANPEDLVPLAQGLRLARLSLNGETVFQLMPPLVTMGTATIELPIGAFLQATAAAEEVLAQLVLDGIGKARSVADLFCGVGPFALRIAERAKVAAFDADRPAIAALQKAARHTQGLKPITAAMRDLFREPLDPFELEGFDAVVLDPPRAGAAAQAHGIARSAVRTVVMVSCDPGTFSRDAAILVGGGYRLEHVTPVDQFAWSPHVEIVGVFRR